MLKTLFPLGFLCFFMTDIRAQDRNCHSMENLNRLIQENPTILNSRNDIESFTQQAIDNHFMEGERAVINIPVVVHVVYNTSSQNIPDAQILSQIDVLNKDFRKLNSDWASIPSAFSNLVADCEINFCLATKDPNGANTNGIIRKSTSISSFTDDDKVKYTTQGGSDAWPSGKYLNLWVCNLGTILGYAQFPGGPVTSDGVVIGYTCFGTTGTATYPFNKGRTATHEVGHWLNLSHIWGDDGTSCTGSDNVTDTPNQADENYGCPTYPNTSCSNTSDMHMNYMDYTNDACMYMFSTGQKARMQSLFTTGGYRASILTSTGCSGSTISTYCSAAGTNTQHEWISKVALNTLNNTTGANGGYGNYTTLSTTVNKGSTYTLALTPSFASTTYPQYFRVYIDYNNDKDFLDANELIYTSPGTISSASTTILIPTIATTATTRMRVIMKDGPINSPCEIYTYGEVEDYSINIQTAATTCTDNYETNETQSAAKLIAVNTNITAKIGTAIDIDWFKFSNTSTNKNIKIQLTNLPADYDVKMYNASGTLLYTSENDLTVSETIIYNNAPVGTYYIKVYGYGGTYSASSCYTLKANIGSATFKKADTQEEISIEVPESLSMLMYPNPSFDGNIEVQFENKFTGVFEVVILDATGKIIQNSYIDKQNELAKFNLNLTESSNGIYFVMIKANGYEFSNKLMINK